MLSVIWYDRDEKQSEPSSDFDEIVVGVAVTSLTRAGY